MSGEKKLFHKHYKNERKWSDKFLVPIARELGEAFIVAAPDKEDMCQNTDLIVFNHKDYTYAARVWRHRYNKFKDEFTIRCGVASGAQTELDKIMDGFGDYMFYGIANKTEDGFSCYSILDLDVFRAAIALKPRSFHENQDGTQFAAFKYDHFPKGLLVSQRGLYE